MHEENLLSITKNNKSQIEKLNSQRRAWLYASSVVFVGIILLIFGWDFVDNFHTKKAWWAIVSLMLILSINWWYWTIRVIRMLIQQRRNEIDVLSELIVNIKLVKTEVSDLSKELQNLRK